MTDKPNGGSAPEDISKLSADAVRECGRRVVEDIRKVVWLAREEADKIEQEAQPIIEAIENGSNALADRVTAFTASLEEATKSMRSHRMRLEGLPTTQAHVDLGVRPAIGDALRRADVLSAVTETLNEAPEHPRETVERSIPRRS